MNQTSAVGEREANAPIGCHNRHQLCQQEERNGQPESTSIVAAIDRLIADGRAGGGPEIEFYDELAAGKLRPELLAAVFFIVRELLLNACRHAKSKNVLVGLAQDDNCVCIQVQDWGIGFDPEMDQPHKCGLKGIREVARRLGGTVDIDSRPGAGTCIVVEIPLLQKTEPGDQTCERKPR